MEKLLDMINELAARSPVGLSMASLSVGVVIGFLLGITF